MKPQGARSKKCKNIFFGVTQENESERENGTPKKRVREG